MSFEKDKSFEEQLRKARPSKPNLDLQRQIGLSMAAMTRSQRFRQWRVASTWAGMAIAASVLITFGVLLFNGRLSLSQPIQSEELIVESPALMVGDTPFEAPDAFRPVLAENNLKGRVDEGIVFLKNGLTARRYRYEFVDRVVWRNPSDGAVVEMEIPRDEVVLIPVQTF